MGKERMRERDNEWNRDKERDVQEWTPVSSEKKNIYNFFGGYLSFLPVALASSFLH